MTLFFWPDSERSRTTWQASLSSIPTATVNDTQNPVLGTTAAKRVLLFIVNRTAQLAFNKPQRIKKMNENITKIKFQVSLTTFQKPTL